jgi:hypothetical protein
MPRWRQCRHTGKFIPVDESARRAAAASSGVAVHGDIEPFVSPVDGSVISDRKQLREHNKRNNVVNADEFSPEYYEQKAKERAKFYNRERTKKEIRDDRMKIYETINQLERR